MHAQPARIKYYHFQNVLLSKGWQASQYIGVDDAGFIKSISGESPSGDVEHVEGFALPGFQNCHSHAFQFAMAGMAEMHKPGSTDDFWSWREAMYQCALSMDPGEIQIVATALYIELVKRGYTSVAEFHYLHHDKDGKPYGNIAEISVALLAAAAVAGIRITLVPVHYKNGGFGKPATPRQRRFIFRTPDEYFSLLEKATSVAGKMTTARMGFGVHSLRATDASDIVKIFNSGPGSLPFHLHAAEQLQEVDDCLTHLNARPVEWLLDNMPVDTRFNIVHCTHLNDEEVIRLAKSKANVVLCPGTEGNLGDGIFRLSDFSAHKGNWCIGTDSHVSLNPVEDLRWLDYGQRLGSHKRNTFDDGGMTLISTAYHAGCNAMGQPSTEFFEVDKPLDAVVYNAKSTLLADANPASLLSRILYTTDSSAILGTIVNGKWLVKAGHHREEDHSNRLMKKVMKSLADR